MLRRLPLILLLAGALAAAPACSTVKRWLGPRNPAPEAPAPEAAPEAAPAVPQPAPPAPARADEASHIVVAHILIAHEGAKLVGVTRSIEEAGALARRVHERAQRGEDFSRLTVLHTDDLESEGTYHLANWGVSHESRGEIDRVAFLRRFGRHVSDAAFSLAVGETTLVAHDPSGAPLGFSILRRVR